MASQPMMNVFDFVVNEGHGVTGLAQTRPQTVPQNYVQPTEERFDRSKVIVDESLIPIVDVSSWDDDDTTKVVCDAARKYGFFQIINHGIPEEVLEAVEEGGRRFFELPAEEKSKYRRDLAAQGTATYGTSFVPESEMVLEWKDYLQLRYVSDQAASQNWPPVCKDQALEFYKRIVPIASKIYDLLLKGLNVKGTKGILTATIGMNFNYYPPCPSPELTIGLGRHSDISYINILHQDDVGGLYVRAPDGESWAHVPPTKGALVVNIGDMMQIMSNGRYTSVEHKVVANPTRSRLSLAVFVTPEPSQVVGPLPEVLAGGDPAKYREVVFDEYTKYFFSKKHDGKATVEWAKI